LWQNILKVPAKVSQGRPVSSGLGNGKHVK